MTEALRPRSKRPRTNIRPEQKTGERPILNGHWRNLFLDALAETSNVSASAAIAGITTSRAYKVRRHEPDFARQWNQALLEGYEHLEMETVHRLRMGTAKDDPKFDIANALRILALHKTSATRERARQDAEDEDAIYASINDTIDMMRNRQLEVAQMLDADSAAEHGMACGE